ncbi:hypothetical protein PAECIP112173_00348 [Paenibacillus sp. JJ-100]|nr:hypothetical protein PAECIP112173_00348 [Paenibacillus sp. JJ-100]
MSNQVTSVTYTLDRPRNFIFDLNAMVELEGVYGSYQEALDVLKGGKIKDVITWLWAGFVHEEQTLTIQEMGRILSATDPDIVAKLGDELLNVASRGRLL